MPINTTILNIGTKLVEKKLDFYHGLYMTLGLLLKLSLPSSELVKPAFAKLQIFYNVLVIRPISQNCI